MVRVSVVVPHFNQAQSLPETVDSVLGQTFQDFEIQIVDDASTDPEVPAVLHRLARHEKVQVHFEGRRHIAGTRNFGISQARGEFIFVLDSDDLIHPNFLEEALHILETQPEVALVGSWIQTFGVGEWLVKPAGGDLLHFLHKNNCPGSAMFRKQDWHLCGGYREELKNQFEDWDFYLSLLELGKRCHIIEQPYLLYRTKSVSANTLNHARRLENDQRIITLHQDSYQKHLLDVLLLKEQQVLDRQEVLKDLLLTHHLPLPEVTYGDGGMAFAVLLQSLRS